MTPNEPYEEHLEPDTMAAYVDGRLSPERNAIVEAHLAGCAECVDEVADLRAILRSRRTRWKRIAIPLTAAAAVILLVAVPTIQVNDVGTHRDSPAAVVETPAALSPAGLVSSARRFEWGWIEEADHYRVTLFDSTGTAIWTDGASGTTALLPDTIRLVPSATYLWQVEARIGFDRWLASELQRFELAP